MNSIERATRILARRRERRANDARLRQLRSTPSGRAILAHENGETQLSLTLAVNVAEFAVWAIEELVMPPDAEHPHGSRWTLEDVTAESTRSIYTFQRVPMSTQVPKG